MTIIIKNKDTLLFDHFKFKCCVGKNGFSKNKREGDKKTPVGNFFLGPLFYRDDKNKKPQTKIKLISNYNYHYYDKNKPKVSDQEYDNLKKDILNLEKKYIFLDSKLSPSKAVGFKPSKNFKKVLFRIFSQKCT